MSHSLEEKFGKLVENGLLKSFSIEEASADGIIGEESDFRNTEVLTLVFPDDSRVRVSTFCSGCSENTCLMDFDN